jgi:dihydroxyacetone kinase
LTEHAEPSVAAATGATIAVANALEEASAALCQLDAAAGDGDHGLAMSRAAQGFRAKLRDAPPKDVPELLYLMAAQFADVGGAMGAIGYVLLHAVGEATAHLHGELTATDVVTLLAVAQDAVSEFGGAKPGDKTIIDAISAAHEAASESARSEPSTIACLRAAAQGARNGAEMTASMIARVGRASRLGELSRGTVDPGAQSFAISLNALATWFAGEKE